MEKEERELTVPEGMVKVILAATAAFLMKTFVERSVESGFRKYRH
jgi:hypothetical protein